FSIATYEQAKPFVLEAVAKIRQGVEALANLFLKRNLPVLGPPDDRARHLLNYLLAGVVCPPVAVGAAVGNEIAPFPIPGPADALGELAKAMGATVGYELRLTVGVTVTLGVYVDKTGTWGFYDGLGGTPLSIAASLSDPRNLGGEVKITTVFGGRDSFSGRSVYVLGGKVTMKGITVGGDVILSASPLGFLGFDIRFGLSARMIGAGGDSEPARPKFSLTTNDGSGMALAADLVAGKSPLAAVAGKSSDAAPSWDAATRAALNPGDEEAIRNTALAAAMSPFVPRYYGLLTVGDDECVLQSVRSGEGTRELLCAHPIVDSSNPLQHNFYTQVQPRSTWRLIRGLRGEDDCVSIEADLDGSRGYISATDAGTRLVDRFSATGDFVNVDASFRLVRGLAHPDGVSFQSRGDASKYLFIEPGVVGGVKLGAGDGSAVFKGLATFRINNPRPLPARERAVLARGEILGGSDRVRRSADGRYVLELVSTGSLMIRRGSDGGESPVPELIWSSPGGAAGSYHATLLDGCRLAVFHGTGPEDRGALLWASEVHGEPGNTSFAVVTAAGCLAVFQGSVDRPGELVWSSRSGRVHWARERTARVSLRTYNNHYLHAGEVLGAQAIARGRDELFELLTLWN
ncbi:MAG: AbfB domain-containing protein, partial [Myxococcales bacterium]|nr:AbfB domain-containing protein [Myxococcales bacterium]